MVLKPGMKLLENGSGDIYLYCQVAFNSHKLIGIKSELTIGNRFEDVSFEGGTTLEGLNMVIDHNFILTNERVVL